ncbi:MULTISPECIES: hypothetical protein [Vibrio]|uniref:hypothetical protein n=1 Tax=Vibrio TaxID=662 RepID=UPI00078BA4D6|nr:MULTISPECIES: hypothetical protein [Vibrio]BAU70954.1 hypothetical protein [Vibrio sp. 04Ya108]BBM67788.1 hypothetical protein VA249_44340 [Vibrio alfacsensis]BCN26959.1 hypothetical protein VYA_41510 [Vibrio alfacsensis]
MENRINTIDYLSLAKCEPMSLANYLPMSLVKKALSLSNLDVEKAKCNGELSVDHMTSENLSVAMVRLDEAVALYDQKLNRIANIKAVLIECWQERSIYSHSEFFTKLGFDYRNPSDRKAIQEALTAIDKECCQCGVLLSSLLYLVHDDLPPKQYFERAVELNIVHIDDIQTIEQKRSFWDDQLLNGWSSNLAGVQA